MKVSQYLNLHNFQYQIIELKPTMVLKILLVKKEAVHHVFNSLLSKHLIFPVHLMISNLGCRKLAVLVICNIWLILWELWVFYVIIPQRKTTLLQQCIEAFNRGAVENNISAKCQKLFCDTRWVEYHTSIFDYCTLFRVMIHCLEIVRQNEDESIKWDRKSITEANDLLQNLHSSLHSVFIWIYIYSS